MDIEGNDLNLAIKWGKNTINLETASNESLEAFRAQLYSVTSVLPEKQKLMFKGKFLKDDQKTLKDLDIVNVVLLEFSINSDGSS